MKRLASIALLSFLAACPGDSDDDDPVIDGGNPTIDAGDDDIDAGDDDIDAGDDDIDAGDDDIDGSTPACENGDTLCVDEDTLQTCVGGQPQITDCPGDQECKAQGEGFACVDPVAPGQFTVTGKIQYQDRVPGVNAQGGAPLGPVTPAAARGVTVAVIQDSGSTVLATGYTAADGTYTLNYTAPAGTQVHILASTVSTVAAQPWRVQRGDATQNDPKVHGFGGASFAAAATVTNNVLVTEASGAAGAFNVFDQLYIAGLALKNDIDVATIVPLSIKWHKGFAPQTSFWNGEFITLLGSSSDDDGYDDAVILHEFGHYFEDKYSQSDSPGGFHDGSPTTPTLAWGEGFSTYLSSALRNNFFYMDSNSGGGFSDNIDAGVTKFMADGSGQPAQNQDVSELMVSEILWDIGDGPTSDDDVLSGVVRHGLVLQVGPKYLRPQGGGKGFAGVDLVDWFHGWVILNGTGICTGLKAIATQHTWPIAAFGCP